MTQVATPLSRKAVLVAVSISMWTARKLDRKITDEVNKEHGATQDAGRYNKLLIESKRLADLTKISSAGRALHYEQTLPWADEGPRVLPNARFEDFCNKFRKLKREFDAAADDFERAYPEAIEERKRALNGMFKAADYPTPGDIRSKFAFEMKVLPFPDAQDFRADLDADTVADIRAEIEKTTVNVADEVLKATTERIVKAVGHMAEKLKEYDNPKKKSFFLDSLVENVRDLAELLPAFNLTEDPALTAITDRIKKELCVEDAQALRDKKTVRKQVRASADQIVADVTKFFGP
jgi:hypothetical protein